LNEKIRCILTNEIVFEYLEILSTRARPDIAVNVVKVLLGLESTMQLQIHYRWNLLYTDPDDNKFADAAIVGNADYLVSNDAHFGALRSLPFPRVWVITPKEFLQHLESL
jgi:uncharacterized protein